MSRTNGPITMLSEPRTYEGRRVFLEARTWRFRLGPSAFMWSRPVAVYVEEPGGRKRIPVRDETRRQLILAASLLCLVVGSLTVRRQERSFKHV